MLEKPKLFLRAKEFWLVMVVLAIIISIRLAFLYSEYQDFVSKRFYFTNVEVLQQYQKTKKGITYTVLRVHSRELNLDFFTTTAVEDNFLDKVVRLKLFPRERIGFLEYLGTSFISSEINEVWDKPKSLKSVLLELIGNQHSNPMITNFYQAIFFAIPLQKELREEVSKLGVSHLIALSGFHLAILSGVLFFLLRPFYHLFQQRYFPYRFDLIDIGFVVLIILGWFVWFIDSPASLLRSFIMMAMGWIVLIVGVELLSFAFLVTVVMLLLVLFPKMLASLAFWFSILGVFYIFLLLQKFDDVNRYLMTLIISFGIFVLMFPIVHMIFPITSSSQLYSPFLSFGFTVFYPLAIGLHLVGLGTLFDTSLLELFAIQQETIDIKLSIYYGVGYLLLSLGAIYSMRLFWLLFLVTFGFMGWIFMGF